MKTPPRHHGFAMVTAIFLLSLTAMAVTEIGLTIAADARRTAIASQDAQLRQLLIVASDFALAHPTPGRYTIPLPDQIPATLTIDLHPDHTADVEAAVGGRRQSEHLTLARHNRTWQITQAILP